MEREGRSHGGVAVTLLHRPCMWLKDHLYPVATVCTHSLRSVPSYNLNIINTHSHILSLCSVLSKDTRHSTLTVWHYPHLNTARITQGQHIPPRTQTLWQARTWGCRQTSTLTFWKIQVPEGICVHIQAHETRSTQETVTETLREIGRAELGCLTIRL